jgi:glutamate-1-semialdehyde 2,1-aminomutase
VSSQMTDGSSALGERARRHMPGGNTRTTVYMRPQTPYLIRGEGCWVTDSDDRRLIDLQNNYTALVHGHCHPAVTEAGRFALGLGASFGMPTPTEIDFAEILATRLPGAPRWRFTNSGTEAVMYALRATRAFTGRGELVRFAGAYHGGYDQMLNSGPGIPDGMQPTVHVIAQGDSAALQALLRDRGEQIAAVIIDLMPNRAGLRPVSPEFVELARRETTAVGALLVFDEVITSRLAVGGMQARYAVEPDLTTLGKVIGGGLPIGAFGGRTEVMDCLDPLRVSAVQHGGTFNANPVVMRMGSAALNALDQPEIDRINALGDRLRAGLRQLGLEVTGVGSLLRLLGGDRHDELWWAFYNAGVLICANGLMAVSTAMDDGVIDEILVRSQSVL